jgi:putative FmdB family regulatory protein
LPLYDYRCRDCSTVTEVRHGFREAYDGTCPNCGGGLARVFNPAGIVFKGSGFYVNDSRKPSASEGAGSPATASGSDAKPAAGNDAKPAAGTDAKPAAGSTPAASSSSTGSDSSPKKSESSAA